VGGHEEAEETEEAEEAVEVVTVVIVEVIVEVVTVEHKNATIVAKTDTYRENVLTKKQ